MAWPGERPEPAPGSPGLSTYLAALRRHPTDRALSPERLDPVAIPLFKTLPVSSRLRLLDGLFQRQRPLRSEHLDRFIEAYLVLAERGAWRFPGRGRRTIGIATTRALELMSRLFRQHWRHLHAVPGPWWQRFMATFRAAGEARLYPVRATGLAGTDGLTPMRVATDLLLRSVANPFAWEPDIHASVDRLLHVLGEDVLLFPAASPSAYAKHQSGRFVVDAAGRHPPVPPEGLDPSPASDGPPVHPRWWIIDTAPALDHLARLRRNLALGVPAERVHPVLPEIPPASRRVILERLERILSRRARTESARPTQDQLQLVAGLETAVRHNFARRWSHTDDPAALAARVRMQSEMGTRTAAEPVVQTWEVLDTGRNGLRLRGDTPPEPPLIGRIALLLETIPDGTTQPGVALVRWQRIAPDGAATEIGLERLRGQMADCWCAVGWRSGAAFQEHPAILLTATGDSPELLCPAGLFKSGALGTIRTDNQNRSVEFIRLREADVHFERIEVRFQQSG
ncbi:MAG TPA: hypothetical protein VJ985_03140 [Gammaproteobacteria bacterium]|nr:hypothetical protein [Gammaproteobacteria bacterium]